MSSRPLLRRSLFVALTVLPLLLLALALGSGMRHGLGFTLVAVAIPALGLAAGALVVADRPGRASVRRGGPGRFPKASGGPDAYHVLVSVALASSGPGLLRVARALAPSERLRLTALHLWDERDFRSAALDHQGLVDTPNPLRPLMEQAEGITVDPLCFVSSDVGTDIAAVASEREVALVLLGWHHTVVQAQEVPSPVQAVLQQTPATVGVYLARHFRPWQRVLVPYGDGPNGQAALALARRLARHGGLRVTVLRVIPPGTDSAPLRAAWVASPGVRLKLVEGEDSVAATIREVWTGYGLVVTGGAEVGAVATAAPALFAEHHERLAYGTAASLLVVRAATTPLDPAKDSRACSGGIPERRRPHEGSVDRAPGPSTLKGYKVPEA